MADTLDTAVEALESLAVDRSGDNAAAAVGAVDTGLAEYIDEDDYVMVEHVRATFAENVLEQADAAAAASEAVDGADSEEEEDDWQYPDNKANQHYIVSLMGYTNGCAYTKNARFTKAELLALEPKHLRNWLNWLAYNTPRPGTNDHPIYRRSDSLKKAKHGVSIFMPNRHTAWIDGRGGNPTIHRSLNELIRKVKKLECRGLGKKENVKRAYTLTEFKTMVDLLRAEDDFDSSSRFVAMTLFMKSMIHRVDDTAHIPSTAPHSSSEFDFCLYSRTQWSKNVTSFETCPDQIIFASKEWKDCPILNLAAYLERRGDMNVGQSVYLFTDHNDEKGPTRLKKQYLGRISKVVWNSPQFKELLEDLSNRGVGGHSIRKFASTIAKRRGGTEPQVEYRGRWVGGKVGICRRSYIDVNDEYGDAFIASLLAEGGPVSYDLAQGVTVTDDWLFTNVVPMIYDKHNFDPQMCRIFAKALLWASFDPEARDGLRLGTAIRDRFVQDHAHIEGISYTNWTPIVKTPLRVATSNGRLRIFRIRSRTQQAAQQATQQNAAASSASDDVEMQLGDDVQMQDQSVLNDQANVHHILSMLQDVVETIKDGFEKQTSTSAENRAHLEATLGTVNNNLRRYGGTIQSAFANQLRTAGVGAGEQQVSDLYGGYGRVDPKATLVDRPKDLFVLWDEWMYGIDGRKAAKSFTTAERNNTKFGLKQKYYRRAYIWRAQARLIDGGNSIISANAKIATVTGAKSVTDTINKLVSFQKLYGERGHPELRNAS